MSQTSGAGLADYGWNCCKPSCTWPDKALDLGLVTASVGSCMASDKPQANMTAVSACDAGGVSTACSHDAPFMVNENLGYGTASVKIPGLNESNWCCSCYQLSFTSPPLQSKKMIVQVTDTGNLKPGQFHIKIPGAGVKDKPQGCMSQWGNGTSLGDADTGYATRDACANVPEPWRAGCQFRFDFLKNQMEPPLNYEMVKCPKELVDRTGCARTHELDVASTTGDKSGGDRTSIALMAMLSSAVFVVLAGGL